MPEEYLFRPIAHIETDYKEKFGIPRQSGLVKGSCGRIVFTPEFRTPDALRAITEFSHLWLIFVFSKAVRQDFTPLVRPPRLGGNQKVGVFASRAPYRPNPVGLSSVRLVRVEKTEDCGTVLYVEGADLLDGTPILDIKPYLPFADSHPDAAFGYSADAFGARLRVECPDALLSRLPKEKQDALLSLLKEDPRPAYQNDPDRIYGFRFAAFEIRFLVSGDRLTVTDIIPAE